MDFSLFNSKQQEFYRKHGQGFNTASTSYMFCVGKGEDKINYEEFFLLSWLSSFRYYNKPHRTSCRQIAKETGMDRDFISAAIKKLVRLGFFKVAYGRKFFTCHFPAENPQIGENLEQEVLELAGGNRQQLAGGTRHIERTIEQTNNTYKVPEEIPNTSTPVSGNTTSASAPVKPSNGKPAANSIPTGQPKATPAAPPYEVPQTAAEQPSTLKVDCPKSEPLRVSASSISEPTSKGGLTIADENSWRSQPATPQAVYNLWQDTCDRYGKPKKKIKGTWQGRQLEIRNMTLKYLPTMGDWADTFDLFFTSDFLQGRIKPLAKPFNFHWFVSNEDNMKKLIDGSYNPDPDAETRYQEMVAQFRANQEAMLKAARDRRENEKIV